jgi:hypothetical protein
MLTRNLRVIWLVVALVLLVARASEAQEGSNEISFLDSLQGDWLNQTYIENLIRTRSPRESVGGLTTAFKIQKVDSLFYWTQIFDFHESLSLEILRIESMAQKNTYLIEHDGQTPETRDLFTFQHPKSVDELAWIHQQGEKKETQIFLRSKLGLEQYINQIALAGDYVDAMGRRFIFHKSGEAQWPDRSFKYNIVLDGEGLNCDCFTIADEKEWKGYGFRWTRNRLMIFDLTRGETLDCGNDPVLILNTQKWR